MINITESDIFKTALTVGAVLKPLTVSEPVPAPEIPPYKIVEKIVFKEKVTRAEVIN